MNSFASVKNWKTETKIVSQNRMLLAIVSGFRQKIKLENGGNLYILILKLLLLNLTLLIKLIKIGL